MGWQLFCFVPLKAPEGLSTQRVGTAHRNVEIETESCVRVGPALFITKLTMTYAALTGTLRDPTENRSSAKRARCELYNWQNSHGYSCWAQGELLAHTTRVIHITHSTYGSYLNLAWSL